jgi:chorismate synthase
MIANENQRSSDYDDMSDCFRPSHADYTYSVKYGLRDPRGGGRSSARETAVRCVGGALAKLILRERGIQIYAYTSQVGHVKLEHPYTFYDLSVTESNAVRCPDNNKAEEMETVIRAARSQGDTVGGVITGIVRGAPSGLGDPVYGKLQAALGAAMLSINAAKGFDYGDGFDAPIYKGSEHNDSFYADSDGTIRTRTNFSGGIQGGISNGQDIYFRVAFKAVSTIMMKQETVNIDGQARILEAKGRHDPCVLPRAVPVVEAMAAMTIVDYLLIQKTKQLSTF